MYGYAGKLLRVDLGKRTIREQPLPRQLVESYIGGAALACKLICDEVPAATEAYRPENRVVIMTGPLTGTEIPGSVKYCLATISPLSGSPAVTDASGSLGRLLKFAGYDGMVIEGAAEDWTYLSVRDGKAELLDASYLAGKDTCETVDLIRNRHGASAEAGCIGPAGENLVRFAGFMAEKEHSASKGGVGAVLGSKRLKAVVVKTPNRGIPVAGPDSLAEIIRQWKKVDDKAGLGKIVSKRGMRGGYEPFYQMGVLAIKNLTTSDFPEHARLNYENMSKCFEIHRNPCPTCNFNHFNRFVLDGEDLKEPSFDTLGGFGPNIGISDPVQVVRLVTLADKLGIESAETSWLIALLMECYQDGIVRPEDLDGLAMEWGNFEAVGRLMRKIAFRQGCGQWMGEGVYRAAQKLGKKAMEKAVYAKRAFGPQLMDNRNDWGFAFGEAVNNVGHFQGTPDPEGLATVEELAERQARGAPAHHLRDSLGICFLHGAAGAGYVAPGRNTDLSLAALNAVTGLNFGPEQFLAAGLRSITEMRLYAIKCGHTREDDSVSPRFLSAPDRGTRTGQALARDFARLRREYYRIMGWDSRGVPLPETLKKLGLDSSLSLDGRGSG